jgi:hypothetical protein
MNREQINSLRANLGLTPLTVSATQAEQMKQRKRRQDANRAAHAQLQRDLKSLRSKNKK